MITEKMSIPKHRKATVLIILCLFLTGCPTDISEHKKVRVPFHGFIAEGFEGDQTDYINLPIDQKFQPYQFTPLQHTDGDPKRKYIVKLIFKPSKKQGIALFLPSLFYPVEVYLNGEKIFRSGFKDIKSRYHNSYGTTVSLPGELMSQGEKNAIAIKFFPGIERHTFKRCFIGTYKDVYIHHFWYSFFHCTLITIFCAISIVYFVIFFSLWISGRYNRNTYLYFSLVCFALIFSYPNLIFSGLTTNELLLTKISRIAFNVAAIFLFLFSLAYNSIVKYKKFSLYFASAIILVVIILFLFVAGTITEVKYYFDITSKCIITPVLILSPLIFTYSWVKNKRPGAFIIMLAIYSMAGTSLHDLFFFKNFLIPYIWLLPVGYLVVEFAISIILALEQAYLTGKIATQSDDLKAANRALIKAKNNAVKANKAKTGFLAKMAHEFRTPLNGIDGDLQLLKDTSDDNAQEHIKNISASSKRLMASINDIIDYSELESGNLELDLSVFNITNRLKNIPELIKADLLSKNIRFEINIHKAMPELIEGDAKRINRIILRLLENSIKYTDTGTITLDVNFLETDLEVIVSDTGKGIPEDKLKEIFHAFEQGESDFSFTRDNEGLGLGLSIITKVVQIMNGSINVRSNKNNGSVFVLKIPVKQIAATKLMDSDFSTFSALIVEDNKINARILGSFLKKIGIKSDVAKDGQEGVERFITDNYNIIFMDVQMPVMNGLEATRAIRQKEKGTRKHIPIIAVTANAKKNECIDAGMDAFIQKPVCREILIETVSDLKNAGKKQA